MTRLITYENFFANTGGNFPPKSGGTLTNTALIDLVADSIQADWGHIKNGMKLLSRASDVSVNTLKGITAREHGVSLKTVAQLSPHCPTLRANLAVLLGLSPAASSEAKKIKLINEIIEGDHDEVLHKLYPAKCELQSELHFH